MGFCGTYSQLPEVIIIDTQILINSESFLSFNNVPGIALANTRILCIFYHLLLLPFFSLFLDIFFNWRKYFIYKIISSKSVSSTKDGVAILSKLLFLFSQLSGLSFEVDRCIDNDSPLINSWKAINAVYQLNCFKYCNQQKLDRVIKKEFNIDENT